MKGFGKVWTPAVLDTYLAAPAATVKGTKMAFAGLKKPEDRAAVIAYLQTGK
jgi:cytochrome c